jgi:succinate dehydrogenase/fumarate reductase flavoprotein subunit
LANLLTVARLMIWSARNRTESRGTHFRLDYPQKNDAEWLRHLECPATFAESKIH